MLTFFGALWAFGAAVAGTVQIIEAVKAPNHPKTPPLKFQPPTAQAGNKPKETGT